ncbi:MAG: glycoside hydrolase family 95 protein [Lachnospiraceae bacterium]|nr:glycoside hydrolase family 95 protein [Lachnospiraceae bacterium]
MMGNGKGSRRSFYLDRPASMWEKWENGLPLGNGKLGAMVMGKVEEETIIINEESLWYGPERDRKNKDSLKYLNRIRELLMKGSVEEAAFLQKAAFMSTPKYNNPYQEAGELRICFYRHKKKAEKYRRILDIERALAEVVYTMDGYVYRREHIVSAKYNVLAVRITTDCPEGIMLCADINRKPFEEYAGEIPGELVKQDIPLTGNWGQAGAGGVYYLTAASMTAEPVCAGDENEAVVEVTGDSLCVRSAREVTIYLTAVTDFEERLQSMEEEKSYVPGKLYRGCPERMFEKAAERLEKAVRTGFETMQEEHEKQYRSYYDRFHLELQTPSVPSDEMPMDKIMEEIKAGRQDYADDMILFLTDYARYLMISSSLNCRLPANLQGIWNGSFEPPWQSQFTVNINLNMNYWFVPKVGLVECEAPFHDLVRRMRRNGRKTARQIYGCGGFCAHHNTNLWACTDIEGVFDFSPFWVMGAAWLCLQLYDNYLYHQDKELLVREILPTMREAIAFFEEYLYEAPDGTLLTGPCVSPENTYETRQGQRAALCMAPTMDISILRQLLSDYQEGLAAAGEAREEKLDRLAERLPDLPLTEDGRIREWYEDVLETEPGHRHISHLFGLHPGKAIRTDTPELLEAAGKTLDYRLAHGGGHTGWSKAWICCMTARLRRGGAVRNHLFEMMQHCIQDNLLDVHPPFQIDGNFGIPEAVLECIAQCHGGCVELLPCLPPEWKDGSVRGLCLRGGITMDMDWKDGRVASCRMKAVHPVRVCLRCADRTAEAEIGSEDTDVGRLLFDTAS